ncbi:hypothetical protein CQ12_30345 [Bradyrhizobium jicamae]|uniref:Uncharacterized protein n=1 Tax=Bradyrhizobium jicamae TaxID=280332 RepID=A0A0R3KBP7_9BRAD|nr:hypothetical protein [Bradyrhizobium jicamae]KRQ92919.1 hypothetical protein CQ12_30345 [Bradyrhizobium jicamae]
MIFNAFQTRAPNLSVRAMPMRQARSPKPLTTLEMIHPIKDDAPPRERQGAIRSSGMLQLRQDTLPYRF